MTARSIYLLLSMGSQLGGLFSKGVTGIEESF